MINIKTNIFKYLDQDFQLIHIKVLYIKHYNDFIWTILT